MPQTPPKLLDGYKANFATLQRAIKSGDCCLISAIRKSDNAPVALVCAVNTSWDDKPKVETKGKNKGRHYVEAKDFELIPIAVMCEGNPFEDFYDPTADGAAPSPSDIAERLLHGDSASD